MKVLIDACVLYPTVMREMVMGVAGKGLFHPIWSERLLEEWARAAARNGDGAMARLEIEALEKSWPSASVAPRSADLDRLVLPDPNDVHVLAAAIAGSADLLLTLNAKDFPRHTLTAEGLSRQDPDGFLRALWGESPRPVEEVGAAVAAKAEALSGQSQPLRGLLKKARMPRLAKALG
ncbi:MAG: PIN domain-containing protein [Pseudomonadota bacterium]